jgi:hypothetical protein
LDEAVIDSRNQRIILFGYMAINTAWPHSFLASFSV